MTTTTSKTAILMGQVRAVTAAVGGILVGADLVPADQWDAYSGVALILLTALGSARAHWRQSRGESH